MTTTEKIVVMKAYTNGEAIQVSPVGFAMWRDLNSNMPPLWNWAEYDYRIKPREHKFRPYKDTAEMIDDYKTRFGVNWPPYAMPLIWVKRENKTALVFAFENDVVWVNAIYSPYCMMSLKKLFDCSTYLDGTPCGKLVEE